MRTDVSKVAFGAAFWTSRSPTWYTTTTHGNVIDSYRFLLWPILDILRTLQRKTKWPYHGAEVASLAVQSCPKNTIGLACKDLTRKTTIVWSFMHFSISVNFKIKCLVFVLSGPPYCLATNAGIYTCQVVTLNLGLDRSILCKGKNVLDFQLYWKKSLHCTCRAI